MTLFRLVHPALLIFVALLLSAGLRAAPGPAADPNVKAALANTLSTAAPGSRFHLLLEHQIRPGWHTYWQNPGDSGAKTEITWDLPPGFEVDEFAWPYPERIAYGPLMNYGYHGNVVYPMEIRIAENVVPGTYTLSARGRWLVCEDICIPEKANLEITLKVADKSVIDPAVMSRLDGAMQKIPGKLDVAVTSEVRKDEIQLFVALSGLSKDRILEVSYFPFGEDLIENPAEQEISFTAEGLGIAVPIGYLYEPGNNLDGVVVIRERVGDETLVTAFEVQPNAVSGVSGETGMTLLVAILFAFLGGMILNLMPCVFPVLSIKILSLMQQGSHLRAHGWIYLLGVVASFLVIAGVLLALRAGGDQIGWGFQLQSPAVIVILIYLFVLIGLNLSGFYEVGTRIMSLGSTGNGEGYAGSFLTGVLATTVAAPCTAPFMASAIGFALTQSPVIALATFASLGVGMATPYVLLCYSPQLLSRLPAPGAWMVTLKELLAFALYASAVWLLWVLSLQAGSDGVLSVGTGLVTLIFAIWLMKKQPRSATGKVIVRGVAAVTGLLAVYIALIVQTEPLRGDMALPDMSGEEVYEPYSESRLSELRQAGPVFVNFTAAWCITCKVNESVALNASAVVLAFQNAGITYLKGDWTNEDAMITKKLAEYGRSGVPLYLLFKPGEARAVVLPQILTEDIMLRAIDGL